MSPCGVRLVDILRSGLLSKITEITKLLAKYMLPKVRYLVNILAALRVTGLGPRSFIDGNRNRNT